MKITKKQLKGGLHEMNYKQLAIIVIGLMLILSTFSSLALVAAEENDEATMDSDMQDEPNIWGEDKYEVKIEGFMGYNDPFSRRSWKTMQQLHDEFGDRITFIFRNYPFEFHEGSFDATVAGECVYSKLSKDSFFKYTDAIMYGEKDVDKEYAIELADELFNIDIRRCVESNEFLPEVQDDIDDGNTKGARGTPTFFIGTKQINGAQSYSVFREAVREQLGDDNGKDKFSLWEGDGFALNKDGSKGFLAELHAEEDYEGKISGAMYVFRDKYRVDGIKNENGIFLNLYDPSENGKLVWTMSSEEKLKEFGEFILFRGILKSKSEDQLWLLTMTLKQESSKDDSSDEEDDEKQDEASSGFRYASWSCYGGATETQGSETSCKSSETWSKYAAQFCEGHCYEDGSKCGVNSFSVSQECGDSVIPRESKVVFSSSVNEVKILKPETKYPITDVKDMPKLISSGEFDSQSSGTAETKEIKVTPVRIESQRAFGFIPKSFWGNDEKRAVVEFNDGIKTSTVTINEGEAKQVEGYVIEVGKIDSEGKIPIAVSSVIGK